MTKGELKQLKTGLLFISPWIVGFLVFTLYPVVASLYYSCCDYDVLSEPVWVGLLNYKEMFTDEVFRQSLYNTLVFVIFALPIGLLLSLFYAVLLNCSIKFRALFRVVFYLPSLVPLVATAMVWLWIYNGKFGLLNYGLSLIGINGPEWLGNPAWTKAAIILTVIWGLGNTIVIYLAALQDVPRHLYEAAEIDGASSWAKLIYITIPTISPVIYFNMIMGLIASLQLFVGPYIMLGPSGGPNRSALFYSVYLYTNAFKYSRMGYACAMAWIMFVIIILLTWILTKATRRHIHYGG